MRLLLSASILLDAAARVHLALTTSGVVFRSTVLGDVDAQVVQLILRRALEN